MTDGRTPEPAEPPDAPEVKLLDSLKDGARATATAGEFLDTHDIPAGPVIAGSLMRDVSPADERDREVEAVAESLRRRGVPTLLGYHSLNFAEHMAAHDLIADEALREIRDARDESRVSEEAS